MWKGWNYWWDRLRAYQGNFWVWGYRDYLVSSNYFQQLNLSEIVTFNTFLTDLEDDFRHRLLKPINGRRLYCWRRQDFKSVCTLSGLNSSVKSLWTMLHSVCILRQGINQTILQIRIRYLPQTLPFAKITQFDFVSNRLDSVKELSKK